MEWTRTSFDRPAGEALPLDRRRSTVPGSKYPEAVITPRLRFQPEIAVEVRRQAMQDREAKTALQLLPREDHLLCSFVFRRSGPSRPAPSDQSEGLAPKGRSEGLAPRGLPKAWPPATFQRPGPRGPPEGLAPSDLPAASDLPKARPPGAFRRPGPQGAFQRPGPQGPSEGLAPRAVPKAWPLRWPQPPCEGTDEL